MSANASADSARRRLAVWWPDWPVTAAMLADRLPAHLPIAIQQGSVIVALSAVARAEGVRRGMRRRAAQGYCPELLLIPADEGRDVRAFEPSIVAVESVVAGIEIIRPGLILAPIQGPARYFGSEPALAEAIIGAIAERTGLDAQVGIADGMLAVVLAARRNVIVEAGTSGQFLAPLPIGELEHVGPGYLRQRSPDAPQASAGTSPVVRRQVSEISELIDLLRRLGIRRLGDFASLSEREVGTRFGQGAAVLRRLAAGLDGQALATHRPLDDVAVAIDLDPPAERIDAAAFAARRLAEEFHQTLTTGSLSCARVQIDVRTVTGEELQRTWRHEGELDAGSLTDRVRWQLEGWLSGRSGATPAGALARVGLVALEVQPAGAWQGELWSTLSADDRRAHRVLTRVQHLLGPSGVFTPVRQGGRDPHAQIRMVAWGDERAPMTSPDQPWPGQLPQPAPSLVPAEPEAAQVEDERGQVVTVDERGAVSAPPAQLTSERHRGAVVAWAGPWPVLERWWAGGRCENRFQLLLADGSAALAVCAGERWQVVGWYD